MPRGPKGEKRPADVIGNAVHVHADRDGGNRRILLRELLAPTAPCRQVTGPFY
jgi:hypothetical protein